MKNYLLGVVLIAFVVSFPFQSAAGSPKKGAKMKTLVVYYSFTGNTEIAAKEIAKELKADLRKVEDLKPYSKVSAYVKGSYAAKKGVNGEIKPVSFSLAGYDKIFVGSPVWAWNPVPAMNTFISNADFKGKEVVTFVTMGGNAGKTLEIMNSKITARGGKIIGSFAIKCGGKNPDEISASAKEEIQRLTE